MQYWFCASLSALSAVYSGQHSYAGDLHPPVHPSASIQCPSRGMKLTTTPSFYFSTLTFPWPVVPSDSVCSICISLSSISKPRIQHHAFKFQICNFQVVHLAFPDFQHHLNTAWTQRVLPLFFRRTVVSSNRLPWRLRQNTQTTRTSTPSEAKVWESKFVCPLLHDTQVGVYTIENDT